MWRTIDEAQALLAICYPMQDAAAVLVENRGRSEGSGIHPDVSINMLRGGESGALRVGGSVPLVEACSEDRSVLEP